MQQKKEIINKLRSSNLRPTKQRIVIAKKLFDRKKTFHFTAETLNKAVNKKRDTRISLATIYNTVEAFKKAGHIREILTNNSKSYYDTNIKSHHHFYDPDSKKLTECSTSSIFIVF